MGHVGPEQHRQRFSVRGVPPRPAGQHSVAVADLPVDARRPADRVRPNGRVCWGDLHHGDRRRRDRRRQRRVWCGRDRGRCGHDTPRVQDRRQTHRQQLPDTQPEQLDRGRQVHRPLAGRLVHVPSVGAAGRHCHDANLDRRGEAPDRRCGLWRRRLHRAAHLLQRRRVDRSRDQLSLQHPRRVDALARHGAHGREQRRHDNPDGDLPGRRLWRGRVADDDLNRPRQPAQRRAGANGSRPAEDLAR